MDARADERWTSDEFLRRVAKQPDRWDLVQGRPVKMTTGARRGRNRAARNTSRHLGNQLADGPCEEFVADIAVRVSSDRIRHPDVMIACSRQDDEAVDVRMVVEVASDGAQPFDATDGLAEYRGVATLRDTHRVETRRPVVELHSRDTEADPWTSRRFEDGDTIDLPQIDATPSVDDIYRGVYPEPVPTVLLR